MKAFGYVRVSGRGQVDGDGPERQEQAIREFVRVNGMECATLYVDNAVSGTVEGLHRPAFVALLDAAKSGDCIVLERMDRLARDLIVSELILKECTARGVLVYAVDQGMVDQASGAADPTRKLIRQIMGALAEWEKSVIVLKLRKARDRKRQETGRCEGVVPFGSTPEEALIVNTMQLMHNNGAVYSRIALEMNRRGYRTRSGETWTKGSVYQVLNRR